MDPQLYAELVRYKTEGTYPHGLKKDQKLAIRRKASKYKVEGGVLYCVKGQNRALKVVLGAEEAKDIFMASHTSPAGAHSGQKKTRNAISKCFFWPGMSVDIDKWGIQPFELVGMDLIGKLEATEGGHQYICVMIDFYTKWPQAYALKTTSEAEVTDCILKFVYQFETPKRILMDQEGEFVNAINNSLCAKLGIQRSLCSSYRPQTNGLVQQLNSTIQRSLCKRVGERPETWADYLDAVLFEIRTNKQLNTCSPFYLMFGREARSPTDIPEEHQVDNIVDELIEDYDTKV